MLLGYDTCGFAHHDPLEALEVIAEIGYQSVALTLDHGGLNPFAADWPAQLERLRALLRSLGLRNIISTGALYLLDPRRAGEPTLVSPAPSERERRIELLKRAVNAAALLDSDCVALSSGWKHDDVADEAMLERLAESLRVVLRHATTNGVTLGFEPQPGMFIDTLKSFHRLLQWIDAPHLELTMNVAHLWSQGELPIADYISRWGSRIVNVHIADARAGSAEHLMFGEGEMRFPPIIESLAKAGYRGAIHLQLPRYSDAAPDVAKRAFEFLQPIMERATRS